MPRIKKPRRRKPTPAELHRVRSWVGRRGYKAKLKKLGIAKIREIARENGKKGGRPKERYDGP